MERMLELYKRSPCLPQKQEFIQRQVVRVHEEITKQERYILYGLTEEEIKMVDGN